MPLDGIAVLERLHELELDPIPRIIVSALGDDLMHQLTNLGGLLWSSRSTWRFWSIAFGSMAACSGDRQPAAQTGNTGIRSEQRSAAEEQAKQSKLSESCKTDLLHRLGIPAHMKGTYT